MAKLFGTNGIRGVFGETFTLDFVSDITLSLATFFKKGPILVGYDGRNSSVIISKIVCSALNSAGLDCATAGLIPTPCLQYVTKSLGYKGGIMITASHNPPEYNGIKPTAHDGVEISRGDELKVEEFYFNKTWKITPEKLGITKQEERAIGTYLDGIKSQISVEKIRPRKFKIVLDLGNGTQAMTASTLCKDLGCEVITINEKIDGLFPGRGSEPTPENLHTLSKTVVEYKADLGVAFDGDGDRSIFCDNTGKILTGDRSAILFSKFILAKYPKSKIVTTLNSTSAIEKIATTFNSKVIRTKVGSVEVSREMVSTKALIGFEENGGFMYGKHNQVRDGAMTMAIALDLLANSTKSMSEELRLLQSSFTKKGKIECSKDEAIKIIQTLSNVEHKKDTTDGIKIILDTSNWVMVRPSGTEPIIRIYAESDSEEKLDALFEKYMEKIKSILGR
ncbi:MAG TPA: phosphoglucosamine mutase [Nitrosopumilaceae archaeon]|nr:phosphoglucosamine mutase [Nitrosopumilaceae archaeon]